MQCNVPYLGQIAENQNNYVLVLNVPNSTFVKSRILKETINKEPGRLPTLSHFKNEIVWHKKYPEQQHLLALLILHASFLDVFWHRILNLKQLV